MENLNLLRGRRFFANVRIDEREKDVAVDGLTSFRYRHIALTLMSFRFYRFYLYEIFGTLPGYRFCRGKRSHVTRNMRILIGETHFRIFLRRKKKEASLCSSLLCCALLCSPLLKAHCAILFIKAVNNSANPISVPFEDKRCMELVRFFFLSGLRQLSPIHYANLPVYLQTFRTSKTYFRRGWSH